MTKEELEKATGQELIEQRNYCGVDGYYGDYLDDVNAEMLKRFNHLEELEKENTELKTKKIPQLERKIASIRGAHSVDCKKLNARTEQVERLKRENAELKEQIALMQDAECTSCTMLGGMQIKIDNLEKENAEFKMQNTNANLKGLEMQVAKDSHRDRANKTLEQLIKAKELLRKFLNAKSLEETFVAESEAEKFLKEVS